MKPWPERAGCSMVARLVCKDQSGRCRLGEIWRSDTLAAATYRAPTPGYLIERVHRPDWDRSILNLPNEVAHAVGYRRDGSDWRSAREVAEELGLDLDAPMGDAAPRAYAAFTLAAQGAGNPQGVALYCPKHRTGTHLTPANIVAMASMQRSRPTRVPLPVEPFR